MISIGKYNKLKVDRKCDFGFYLEDENKESILLPNSSINDEEVNIGDSIEVFAYRDSKDRPIATLKKPLITVGEIAYLKIVSNSDFGAFAYIGLERDIFIPIKEQKFTLVKDKEYLLYA